MAASHQLTKNTLILSAQYWLDNSAPVQLALRKNQACVAFRHSLSQPGKVVMMSLTEHGKLKQDLLDSIVAIDPAFIPDSILYLAGEDTLKVVTFIVSTSWQHTLLRLAEQLRLTLSYVFDSSFHHSQGIFVRLSSINGFFTIESKYKQTKYLVGASYDQTVRMWYITPADKPEIFKHSQRLQQGSIASIAELNTLLSTFKHCLGLNDETKICLSLEGMLVPFVYKSIRSCASVKIVDSGFWSKSAMIASTSPTLVSSFTKI